MLKRKKWEDTGYMKVLHIESGLGNQMLGYCEYLAIKKMNPNDECYIENIIYDIPESHKVIAQWNGYEVDDIFSLNTPNIKNTFTPDQWDKILSDVTESEFWNDYWNYPDAICNALNSQGLKLKNKCVSLEFKGDTLAKKLINVRGKFFVKTRLGYNIKNSMLKKSMTSISDLPITENRLFLKTDEDIYCGHTLDFIYKGKGINAIEKEIKSTFIFPKITEVKNLKCAEEIKASNSVAIHARRGDMLSRSGCYYKYGYFKKAVQFIKSKVENPVFYFFCDPGSIEWCKQNSDIFSLDFSKDSVRFVDWNKGNDSFRDMQLMSMCKHNIVTNSSFGWWGAYLNQNPDKITCSPDARINTTHNF